jgi:hypothetical protein
MRMAEEETGFLEEGKGRNGGRSVMRGRLDPIFFTCDHPWGHFRGIASRCQGRHHYDRGVAAQRAACVSKEKSHTPLNPLLVEGTSEPELLLFVPSKKRGGRAAAGVYRFARLKPVSS